MGKKYLDTKEGSLEQSVLGVWQTAIEEGETRVDGRTKAYKEHRTKLEAARLRREKKNFNKEEVKVDEGDKEDYTKFFNAALKKFGVDSPADFKSDEEKKKFFNYVDKNYEGDHEEEVQKLHQQLFPETKLKESKKYAHGIGKVNAAFEIGTPEYRQHTQSITPGQDITDYQRFKVQSMKEALAKVWGLDEAKKEEKDLTNELKGGKTMTGKKANEVDVKPEIKDK